MTTTHMSAGRRRRQRLRRTLVVAAVVLVVGGAAGYAARHDDPSSAGGSRVAAGPGAGSSAPLTASKAKQKPAKTKSSGKPSVRSTSGTHGGGGGGGGGGAKTAGGKGFAPVITDRIPAPTTSVPLSAPIPGMTNMQPSAAAAFTRAFAEARAEGLSPEIRSAWRSAEYQQILFDRAVTRYGSRAEAAKWVLPPVKSAHVKGYAIDVHPQSMASWLQLHGPAYGICRTYDNEWWHFEYLATSTCPPRKPTAAG